MDLDDAARLLGELADGGQLVHLARLPTRPARHRSLPLGAQAARALGDRRLWTHQAEAIERLQAGRSVALATGTASGKSLCYQVPIAAAVADDPPGTALLVFPTKALAQDQLRAFAALGVPGLVAATYDGDTGPEARAWIRRHANVLLTNPEMLHTGILPRHERWATFLKRLRFVVVDELHVLRGVFGSHVAHVLRRLRRVCAHYASTPTMAFSSATIGEPGALASILAGLDVAALTDDGSPRGERLVAVWNPPLLDEGTGTRGSAHVETARLVAALAAAGHRTLAFTRSRRATETVAAMVRRALPEGSADAVRAYRGGYLAEERRTIESDLFEGRLRAVVATSALELGIDVGGLDAVVLDGFPGTIASFWQQAGRAGRAQQGALAVLVAGADQLDQWLAGHPAELLSRPPEPAVVNLGNPYVLHPHLACAAYELPLTPADATWWGVDLDEGVRRLVLDDRLRLRDGRAFWAGRGSPAPGIGLRSGWGGEVRIALDDGRLVGTVEPARALRLVHPGAIYLHQGAAYRVRELRLDDRVAVVEPTDDAEDTRPRTESSIRVLSEDRAATVGRARVALGAVEVTSHVVGFQRRDLRSGEWLGVEPLDLPPTVLATRGVWWTVDDEVVAEAGLDAARLPGTLHAVEHAAIGILPLFTICDRWDVGGVSTARQADTGLPTVVIYDGFPGGAGIAELGFAAGERHLRATLDLVAACPCAAGCPSCVQSPKCGNGNEPLDKAGAVALLGAVLA
ncbi:MAG: DEAD/DEAH box helicase [Acidimicrobiales bacterium]|nr:DEAD/DEAH box helicase [Acidimicrobiales bacterium]